MKIRTEAKIGIIVIATIVLVIWGINYLKGKNILKRTDVYYAVYDNAKGLEFAAPVFINGYKVGLINRFFFDETDLNRIIVAIVVDKQYQIPKGSVAKIISADIMSSKAIEIELSRSEQYHVYGDTLASLTEPDMISELRSGLEPLLNNVGQAVIKMDSLLANINEVFDDEGVTSLQASLDNLKRVSTELRLQLSSGGDLTRSFSHLEKVTSTLSNNRENLNTALSNLASVSDTLKQANIKAGIDNLNLASEELHTLLSDIRSGEGTLGQLAVNDSLYNKLVDVSVNLDLLLRDLREHPKRYVHFSIFGKKDKN